MISLYPHCAGYDEYYNCIDEVPDLCRYLSITPSLPSTDAHNTSDSYTPYAKMAEGILALPTHSEERWNVSLRTPCIEGSCPTGYDAGVYGTPIPQSLKGATFRCDVHVETNQAPVLVRALGDSVAYAQEADEAGVLSITATFTGETPVEEPTCGSECYSNVMFLPGIMGSRLFQEDTDCGIGNEQERWVSSSDCDHAYLRLDENGKSVYPLYTKEGAEGVIDDTYNFNIYQSFMHDLDDWKSEGTINEYALIPYDWRLSLEDILQNGSTSTGELSYSTSQGFHDSYIYRELRRLANSSKTHKVTIIAHSNGGLVTKALIQKLKDTHDPLFDQIDKVILVAVPQAGTPEAIGNILHGTSVGSGVVMSAKRERDLVKNMPAAYNLLPTDAYVGSGIPLIEFSGFSATSTFAKYGAVISSIHALDEYLLGDDGRTTPHYTDLLHAQIANETLLSNARAVHTQLDQWQPATSTEVYEIAGWGIYTPMGIKYSPNKIWDSTH
jgi:pimeloyl-ACP methyl ester carboxylesterase